ncbi:MAG: 4Fe-4S binding protein [Clostridiales bacterium]|jgi:2-oxoacid:acceptor oxidoreductase delta subunit (pyruvate/2-ketoisovalerate family)|nr:4Fe-4S binding protein [Clostridiales bacterium]
MQRQQEKPTSKLRRFRLYGPCSHVFDASHTGSWRVERPDVAFDKCVKCGICATCCPANVITVDKGSAECVRIMWDYCKGCGICANECPQKAIAMIPERSVK